MCFFLRHSLVLFSLFSGCQVLYTVCVYAVCTAVYGSVSAVKCYVCDSEGSPAACLESFFLASVAKEEPGCTCCTVCIMTVWQQWASKG